MRPVASTGRKSGTYNNNNSSSSSSQPTEIPAYLHTKARLFIPGHNTSCHVGEQRQAYTSAGSSAEIAGLEKSSRTQRKVASLLDEAAETLQQFQYEAYQNKDSVIPISALQSAKGIVVLMVTKVAVGISARGGRGIVVGRLRDGKWSAPSCVSFGGVGLGLELGGERSGIVILLQSEESLSAFMRGSTNSLGGNFTATAGPRGRNIESDKVFLTGKRANVFTFSRSKGLFLGASLEWALFKHYVKGNQALYPFLHEDECVPWEILSGRVPAPAEAQSLYRVLDQGNSMTSLSEWKSRVSGLSPPINTMTIAPPVNFLGLGASGKPNFPSTADSYVRHGKETVMTAWPTATVVHNPAGVVRVTPATARFARDV